MRLIATVTLFALLLVGCSSSPPPPPWVLWMDTIHGWKPVSDATSRSVCLASAERSRRLAERLRQEVLTVDQAGVSPNRPGVSTSRSL